MTLKAAAVAPFLYLLKPGMMLRLCTLLMVMRTKPLFVNQMDGESVITNPELARFKKLLYEEKPDVVFAHWPIDSHKDARERKHLFFILPTMLIYLKHNFKNIKLLHVIRVKILLGQTEDTQRTCTIVVIWLWKIFRGKELGVHDAEAFIKMTGKGNGNPIVL